MVGQRSSRWVFLALVSGVFMVTTGTTFSSLGIVLPHMNAELGWDYTQSGAGFTLLALMTGLSSTLPAATIRLGRQFGLPLTYLTGGLVGALGFSIIASANSLLQYYIGAGLVGIAYSQTGMVPAVSLISAQFTKKGRSMAIGIFLTFGAVGSVLAPIVANNTIDVLDQWRPYWFGASVGVIGFTALTALVLVRGVAQQGDLGAQDDPEAGAAAQGASSDDWTLLQTFRTPQYAVIIFGLTIALVGTTTMNVFQYSHMINLGVGAQIAAVALSVHALFNALGRAAGGVLTDIVGAKWLFVSGLAAGTVGMVALAYADTPVLIGLFAVADGYCFGIVLFSSTVLLLNYFGATHNPAILGTCNLITTIAMLGPVVAGYFADRVDSFTSSFVGIGVLTLVACLLAVPLTAPKKRASPDASDAADAADASVAPSALEG